MPPSRRVSQRQLELLLAFAEANRDIALGRCTRGPQGSQTTQQAWDTVANRLNAVADGVTKTPDKWRRYWIEWKAKTKNKAADLRRSRSKTGGGSNRLAPLTELEERVLQLIGKVAVEGLPGIEIPFHASMDSPSNEQPGTSQAAQPSINPRTQNSLSEMEEEWLEDEEFQSFLPQQASSPPQSENLPPPCSPPLRSPSPPPRIQLRQSSPASPPRQSPPPQPPAQSPAALQPPAQPPAALQPPAQPPAALQPPAQPPAALQPPAAPRAPAPQQRPRRRLIRDRDVPQWARDLEERRLEVEEIHANALRDIANVLDNRLSSIDTSLSNIDNSLRTIINKISNN